MKKPTSKDVAKLAGVSQSTVSMILSGSKLTTFSDDTVHRVTEAANKLNYGIRNIKRSEHSKKQTILVVCPNFSNQYYVNLIEAIQERATELGYYVLVNSTFRNNTAETEFIQMICDLPIAGVIFTYLPSNTGALEWLDKQIPLVLLYDKNPLIEMDIVELNSTKLGMIVAEHLINLGHRRIAYISTPLYKEQSARRRRLEGLEIKFAEHGISTDNIIVCTAEGEGIVNGSQLLDYETGYKVAEKIAGKYDVTAMVGTNDMVAIGIMDALIDQKYRIPQDFSVCGCDNTTYARLRSISLTSVEHFSAQKGKESVDILVRKIERSNIVAGEAVSVIRIEYAPKLIARNSSGVCRREKNKLLI